MANPHNYATNGINGSALHFGCKAQEIRVLYVVTVQSYQYQCSVHVIFVNWLVSVNYDVQYVLIQHPLFAGQEETMPPAKVILWHHTNNSLPLCML